MTQPNLFTELPFTLPPQAKVRKQASGWRITLPNAELLFIENFLNENLAQRAYAYLTRSASPVNPTDLRSEKSIKDATFLNIPWRQETMTFSGNKTVAVPRLTSWHGDKDAGYTYSGIKSKPESWNEGLLWLKQRAERAAEKHFNSVLLNWYRNGQDSVGWHADDEPELGKDPVIASLSLGAARTFSLRHNSGDIEFKIPLTNGSLLVMSGQTQKFWKHSVQKEHAQKNGRINLTFRYIL